MSRPIYELREVVQRYAGRTVLDIANLEVPRGSILGLIGPNGSGKSTLLDILAFLTQPVSGQLLFDGVPARESEDLRRRVTLLLQEPFLLKRPVWDNVAYGLKVRGQRRGLGSKVHEALDLVGLDPTKFAKRRWHELSGGEAQRVSLASRLVFRPEVLLLDEPTASLDRESAVTVREAVLRARELWGTTLIIAAHDHSWLQAVSDQVADIRELNRSL